MKTILALIVGWFAGILTVALAAGRLLSELANGERTIIDVETAKA